MLADLLCSVLLCLPLPQVMSSVLLVGVLYLVIGREHLGKHLVLRTFKTVLCTNCAIQMLFVIRSLKIDGVPLYNKVSWSFNYVITVSSVLL